MKLFEPGKIGKLTIKNRVVFAPMGIGSLAETNGGLGKRGIDYFAERAKGGAGLIITGGGRVSQEIEYQPASIRRIRVDGISSDGTWLNMLAEALHSYGAKVVIQLSAGIGRVGSPHFMGKTGGVNIGRSGMVGPSVLPCFWDPDTLTRELTIKEIGRLVDSFKRAGEILRRGDIDGAELHGHSGYLLDQFMTSLWNKRTDRYGGDLEGRLRFPLEVIAALKQGAGADFPVIYRFGLTHYLPGGREIEEGLEIARRLEAAGVDCLDVDAGSYETHYWVHPATYSEPGCMVNLAAMTKKVVKIPVMTVGKLGFPELAESVLQEGKADFIMLGKGLLADPDWANKTQERRFEDIRPCIGDFECLRRAREGKYISCAVNPAAGIERRLAIRPARKKQSVLVIGGGPGGMEAARVAALRGHKVTLWEKDDTLGGNLIPAAVPAFKQEYQRLIDYLSTQLGKLGVDVKLGKKATPGQIQRMKPDVVFVASGSTPIIPDIPGVKKDHVLTANDLLLGRKEAGKSVVVLGGGLVGCETALHLAQLGKKATVIARHDVASDMYKASRMHLLKLLDDAKVKILTFTQVQEITNNGIIVIDKNGKKSTLAADSIVLAVGLDPDKKLFDSIKDKVPKAYAIGDCVEAREVKSAIWEAYNAARLV
ncbi:MAG: FAD-dependent oxidoreductase [Chloroflexi bacterium]|nr:FAD-dependent oxidoreductase [Chloroflexota bacterium]